MEQRLTPAEVAFRLIGPPEKVGRILNMHEKSPYVWRRGSNSRDPGDLPSTQAQRALLTYAQAHNIPLTSDHLIWGATEAELDALLASPAREDAA